MRRLMVGLALLVACSGDGTDPSGVAAPVPGGPAGLGSGTIRLGLIPGYSSSRAAAINAFGQIVGRADYPNCCRAFLWQAGQLTDIGGLGTPVVAEATDINDRGQVVGWSVNASGITRAFLWQNGVMTDLGSLIPNGSSSAHAINEQGVVVGRAMSASNFDHAFRWTAATGMVDLGTVGGHLSDATDINERGEIVGNLLWSAGPPTGAVYWDANGVLQSVLPPSGTGTAAFYAINDSGVVVGNASTPFGKNHAYSWTPAGGWHDLAVAAGNPGYYSAATGINNAGIIVGETDGTVAGSWCNYASDPCAAAWLPDGSVRLLPYAPYLSGKPTLGSSAADINEAGQMVGTGYYSSLATSWAEGTLWAPLSAAAHVPQAASNGPWHVAEGDTVPFDGSASTDPDGDALEYTWAFNDGSPTASGSTVRHVFVNNRGPYLVQLTVTDPAGNSSTIMDTASVTNVAPTVTVLPPTGPVYYGVSAGWSLTTSDPGVEDLSNQAYFDWGDGTKVDTMAFPVVAPPTLSHAYAAPGTYTLVLRVSDFDGGIGTATAPVQVQGGNRPPVASAGPGYGGVEGSSTAFDGSASRDIDGDSLSYLWLFGDGGTGTGVRPAHVFLRNGNYLVTAIVSDPAGLSDTATAMAYIANSILYADAGSDFPIAAGAPASPFFQIFDAGTLDSPWDVLITWGDGATTHLSANAVGRVTASHTYATTGSYTVVMAVTDPEGAFDTDAAVITVTPGQNPTAVPNGPYSGNEAAAVLFSSAGSSDPQGSALTWFWQFGDGKTSAAANPSHVYADNGVYTVTLMVFDPAGNGDTATTTVTVANLPPSGTFKRPTTAVKEGSAFPLSVTTPTDPSPVDRTAGFQYAFDCGSGFGAFAAAASISCPGAPDNPSVLTGVKIRDKDGGVGTLTGAVPVSNVAPTATLTAGGPVRFPLGGGFTVNGRFTDPGVLDAPWTYSIAWGDGTAATTGTATPATSFPVSHTYGRKGSFLVKLTVKDKNGGQGTSGTITVTVQ